MHSIPIARHVWASEPVRGTGDAEVARLGAAQRGFVARRQLFQAGLTRHAVAHRLSTWSLTVYHPGVYLVGRPSIEPLGRETAAVLFFDGDGVLTDLTAAGLWDLRDLPETVDITLVGRAARSRPGLRVHRRSSLTPADVVLRCGLPVSSPARTLIDLAGALPMADLEQAVAQARVNRLIRSGDLEAALQQAGPLPGVAAMRALLEAEHDPAFTRRALERRMLALVRSAHLPAPRVNAQLLGFEVDFLWPEHRLVVETDGYQFHGHRRSFETDRRRDQILLAAGFRVMRITWRQLRDEPLAVAVRLAMALRAAAA